MRKIFLSAVALTGLAGTAFAADLPDRKEPPVYAPVYAAPMFTWTGFYVGAQLGGLWGQGGFADPIDAVWNKTNSSAVFGGLHAGYNYQINSFVLGLQAEANLMDASGSSTDAAGDVFTLRQTWLGSIDGRLGYAIDRTLIYAIGGVAFTNTSHDVIPFGSPSYGFTGGNSTGYDIGAGIEYAITNHWSARIEYRYYDFGTSSFGPTPDFNISAHNFTKTDNTVRVGLSYLFGGPEAVVARY